MAPRTESEVGYRDADPGLNLVVSLEAFPGKITSCSSKEGLGVRRKPKEDPVLTFKRLSISRCCVVRVVVRVVVLIGDMMRLLTLILRKCMHVSQPVGKKLKWIVANRNDVPFLTL
jgi:hypothetical protein